MAAPTSPFAAAVADAGDLVSGVLLYRLRYWMTRARVRLDGQLWVARSREEWIADSGLTLDQYKRALSVLRERGLVESRQARFRGVAVTHLRTLEQGVVVHQATTQVVHQATTSHTRIQEVLQEGVHSHAVEADVVTPTEPGEGMKVIGAMKGKTAAQVKDLVSKPKVPAAHVCKTVADLERIWRYALKQVDPTRKIQPWTAKEKGQGRHLMLRVKDAGVVMQEVVLRWDDFASHVQARQGLDRVPQVPALGFLLLHGVEAESWALSKGKPKTGTGGGVDWPKLGV